MFENSISKLKELKERKRIETPTLSLIDRINIANDCMEKAKDIKEYKEIEAIRNNLKEEYRLSSKNLDFQIKSSFELKGEELVQTIKVLNQELSKADQRYFELNKSVKESIEEFTTKIIPLIKELSFIEGQNYCVKDMNEFLPTGTEIHKTNIRDVFLRNETEFMLMEIQSLKKRGNKL
ncbi:hypothetical protein LKL81_26065 [Bacillus paranthracis]|uniref:hypothetical protein n=1 Tax=Bacillus paranthracis TaxID=2026186 RepID=UPI001E44BD2A|nr:hypothetical protein [Bacillus paranthracis]MCC2430680.1 hypothetical protein [Bacillus paranthracis]